MFSSVYLLSFLACLVFLCVGAQLGTLVKLCLAGCHSDQKKAQWFESETICQWTFRATAVAGWQLEQEGKT